MSHRTFVVDIALLEPDAIATNLARAYRLGWNEREIAREVQAGESDPGDGPLDGAWPRTVEQRDERAPQVAELLSPYEREAPAIPARVAEQIWLLPGSPPSMVRLIRPRVCGASEGWDCVRVDGSAAGQTLWVADQMFEAAAGVELENADPDWYAVPEEQTLKGPVFGAPVEREEPRPVDAELFPDPQGQTGGLEPTIEVYDELADRGRVMAPPQLQEIYAAARDWLHEQHIDTGLENFDVQGAIERNYPGGWGAFRFGAAHDRLQTSVPEPEKSVSAKPREDSIHLPELTCRNVHPVFGRCVKAAPHEGASHRGVEGELWGEPVATEDPELMETLADLEQRLDSALAALRDRLPSR